MAKSYSGSVHKSQRLGNGFKPRSKLDLFNPGQGEEANEEVVAFLKWLDRRDDKVEAVRNEDNPHYA